MLRLFYYSRLNIPPQMADLKDIVTRLTLAVGGLLLLITGVSVKQSYRAIAKEG
ncbi:MAG: hypothetical protein RMY64_30990 [Nostoc sp. DedQUE08]|nr:hypothetical protein [Nostoc sp. DedQUE08]